MRRLLATVAPAASETKNLVSLNCAAFQWVGYAALMTALQVFATAVLAVLLKQVVSITVQGVGRARTKRFAYPEDTKIVPGSEAGDPQNVVRAQHLIRNSLENEPLFLFILLAYSLAHMQSLADLNSQDAWVSTGAVYAWTFIGARYLHGVSFLLRLQPLRSLSYAVGLLAAVGLGVQVALDAF